MRPLPPWTPRDWRKSAAMLLLTGEGTALTIVAWRLITLVAERSPANPWALAYGLYGVLALIGLVLLALGWALGKAQIAGRIGPATFDASGGDAACDGAQDVLR